MRVLVGVLMRLRNMYTVHLILYLCRLIYCNSQLVLTHRQCKKALDDGLQVDVAFLDFSKAFDRVSHVIILQKLCNSGIFGSLLNWCRD